MNVLYVDDERNNLDSFKANFRKDFNVYTAISTLEAKNILTNTDIHVLITDQRMPNENGTVLLTEAVNNYPNITRILLTGFSDIEALKEAINEGHIYKYIQKPWKYDDLKYDIIKAYKICILKREKDLFIEKLKQINSELENKLKNLDI